MSQDDSTTPMAPIALELTVEQNDILQGMMISTFFEHQEFVIAPDSSVGTCLITLPVVALPLWGLVVSDGI